MVSSGGRDKISATRPDKGSEGSAQIASGLHVSKGGKLAQIRIQTGWASTVPSTGMSLVARHNSACCPTWIRPSRDSRSCTEFSFQYVTFCMGENTARLSNFQQIKTIDAKTWTENTDPISCRFRSTILCLPSPWVTCFMCNSCSFFSQIPCDSAAPVVAIQAIRYESTTRIDIFGAGVWADSSHKDGESIEAKIRRHVSNLRGLRKYLNSAKSYFEGYPKGERERRAYFWCVYFLIFAGEFFFWWINRCAEKNRRGCRKKPKGNRLHFVRGFLYLVENMR